MKLKLTKKWYQDRADAERNAIGIAAGTSSMLLASSPLEQNTPASTSQRKKKKTSTSKRLLRSAK